MIKEEIRNAVMNTAKEYGYEWVMAEFEYDESEDFLNELKSQMDDEGYCQTHIFDGEESYCVLERADVDDNTDLVDVMKEGNIFTEENVYNWITLGRIEAWKELFERGKKKVGYFFDGYGGYVFFPECMDMKSLKKKGEVVVA